MCRDAVNYSAEVGIYLTSGDFGHIRSSKQHDVADGCVSNCVSVFYARCHGDPKSRRNCCRVELEAVEVTGPEPAAKCIWPLRNASSDIFGSFIVIALHVNCLLVPRRSYGREDFSFRSSTEFRKNCRKRTEINSFVD